MPRRSMSTLAPLCFLAFGVIAAPIAADNAAASRVQQAQALFQKFTRLSDQFDPAVAELYADDAQIVYHRNHRPMRMTGRQYKMIVFELMSRARPKRDRSTYADVNFAAEGAAVRINSTRYSVLKRYSSPHTLLVRPAPAGNWRIYEETLHTRP